MAWAFLRFGRSRAFFVSWCKGCDVQENIRPIGPGNVHLWLLGCHHNCVCEYLLWVGKQGNSWLQQTSLRCSCECTVPRQWPKGISPVASPSGQLSIQMSVVGWDPYAATTIEDVSRAGMVTKALWKVFALRLLDVGPQSQPRNPHN